jgi:hypothetical protein
MKNHEIQEALQDLSTIRRIMRQVSTGNGSALRAVGSVDTSLLIHILALVFSSALLVQEQGLSPFAGGAITLTHVLQLSTNSDVLRTLLVSSVGIFLTTLCVGLYVVLWTAARRDNEDLSSYVARNFRPFSAVSFLSDIFVKFCGVAVVVTTGHPEWISPLLLLFTADYLLQGRLFQLSFGVSFAAAVMVIAVGAYQAYAGEGTLSVALVVFMAITAASLGSTAVRKRALGRLAQAEATSHE